MVPEIGRTTRITFKKFEVVTVETSEVVIIAMIVGVRRDIKLQKAA